MTKNSGAKGSAEKHEGIKKYERRILGQRRRQKKRGEIKGKDRGLQEKIEEIQSQGREVKTKKAARKKRGA